MPPPGSRTIRARWVLPIVGPPLRDGWIRLDGDRIGAVGNGRPPAGADDLGDVAILPGLVNAHTHLELSWMAGRVPPAASLVEWLRQLMRERTAGPPGGEAEAIAAAERAVLDARATGTVLVGDVSNTLMTLPLFASNRLGGTIFHELVGFRAVQPEMLVRQAWARLDETAVRGTDAAALSSLPFAWSVVAHAPYSVSAELFVAIARARRTAPLSVHLAESLEEIEFLQSGTGPFRDLLQDLGAWIPGWSAPARDPVGYLAALDYLTPGCLVVHGVHLGRGDLETLRTREAVLVTCPRSNEWVGAGMPPVAHFYASGVPVAVGTDSLASAPSLNLFDELAALRRMAPEVTAASLLESATRVGAEALGFGDRFGTIEPGKQAALVAVRVPAGVGDVEEYLVGGVDREEISAI